MKFRYDSEKEELVVSEATRIEYHQLGLWLTRHVKGYRYMPAFKMGVWNGQQSYFKNGRISLGLWKEAMRGCKEIDAPFILENKDETIKKKFIIDSFIDMLCLSYCSYLVYRISNYANFAILYSDTLKQTYKMD